MSIVVTGATGHIGNTVVKELLKKYKDIKLLVRRVDDSIKGLDVEYVIGNVFEEQFLAKNITRGDTVIHLAGIIDIKNKLKEETYRINYLGTKLIADISLNKGVTKFIYFSSTDVLDKSTNGDFIKEPTHIDPSVNKSNYGYSKALATSYMLSLQEKQDKMKIIILYPSAVIGANDYKPSYVGKVVQDVIKNKLEFGIDGGYNFVDVDDVAKFTVNMLDLNEHNSFILSGTQVSVEQLYKALNKVLNKNKKITHLPMWIVRLACPFVPYLSKFTIDTLQDKSKYDCSKAMKYGYSITPFIKTCEKAVNFQKTRIKA
mgnify:CR=1 FL=1